MSSTRPPSVHLDDLTDPRFSPEVDAIRSAMAAMAPTISLTPEAIVHEAVTQTGLARPVPRRLAEGLEAICRALGSDGDRSAMGVVNAYAQLVGHVRNRLRLDDLLERRPEIHERTVQAPIVICGLPRTGTTHLHNLMSADPQLRSLPYWESLEPVPPADEPTPPDGEDPRIGRCEQGVAFLDLALPLFKRMHEMTTWHVHEEIQLLALDGSTMLFETMGVLPTYRDWYLATDQTPTYELLATILKVLQWQRGGDRWVLKSPQHLEQFPVLRSVFPDATFVVTHRDPVAVVVSMATMQAYTSRLHDDHPDVGAIAAYWADRIHRMLSRCVAEREALPADQSIDVLFHEFMADDIAMVERIYALAGQPVTAEARTAMDAFMADHPRGRHGGIDYDIEQLHLDPSELRRRFAFYTDRFPVELEY